MRLAATAAYFAERLAGVSLSSDISYAALESLGTRAARPEYEEDRELLELIRAAGRLAGEPMASAR